MLSLCEVTVLPLQSYFKRWWDMQEPGTQDRVRILIRNGQLQFAGGGWVSNDEAICSYDDIIDQLTLGHRYYVQSVSKVVQLRLCSQVHALKHTSGKQMAGKHVRLHRKARLADRHLWPLGRECSTIRLVRNGQHVLQPS